MTNIEQLARDICRMKHRDKIMRALPHILATDERSDISTDNQEGGKEK